MGTEHILLGLIREGGGNAIAILNNRDVDLARIRQEVERIVHPGAGGDAVVTARLPHTPRAMKVVEYAHEEAEAMGREAVGTEHLLLGLLHELEGVACQVLLNLGLRLEEVRAIIKESAPKPVLRQGMSFTFPPAVTGNRELFLQRLGLVLDRHRRVTVIVIVEP